MIKIKRKIWLPIAIWVALFLFVFNIANYFQSTGIAAINAAFETFITCFSYYFITLFLFPRYYRIGKGYFWISVVSLFVLSFVFMQFDIHFMPEVERPESDKPPQIFHFLRFLFNLSFVYFVATSLSLMDQTTKLRESEKLLTQEKLATELKLLKAQINPHFIFNALNNIYSLTYMQSKNAPNSVLKLSDMLRYVFYDCSKDRVSIVAELTYIENFIAFQQMKSEFVQNIKMENEIKGANIDIAPMLFIPFIENAFKYSRVEEDEDARIDIKLKYNDSNLLFIIENTVSENKPMAGSGMGIENVKHRLDIIYPNKYKLNIEEEKQSFKVNLVLNV